MKDYKKNNLSLNLSRTNLPIQGVYHDENTPGMGAVMRRGGAAWFAAGEEAPRNRGDTAAGP